MAPRDQNPAYMALQQLSGTRERLNLINFWKRHRPPDGCSLSGSVLSCS